MGSILADHAGGVVRAAAAAALGTLTARRVLGALVPADPRWTRTNHRGAPISLLEGPAAAVGLIAGALAGGSGAAGAAGAVAAAGGAAFGLVDDLSEDARRSRKGLRGHLGALAHGELTTGGLKVLGIGATSLLAAVLATPRAAASRAGGPGTGMWGWSADVASSGALIAATANLVNLLDLRPGRALKAAALTAAPALVGAGAPAAAACIATAAAALPGDLSERDMLGDGGANALGALVGTAAVLGSSRPVRWALLCGAVVLTLASERVSFTQVIARTPVLREIDAWGRTG